MKNQNANMSRKEYNKFQAKQVANVENKEMETFYFVRQPDHMIECSDNFTGSEDVDIIKQKHKIFKTKEDALAYQRELGIGTEADRKCLNKWFAEEEMAEEYGYIKRPSLSIEQLAPDMQLLEEVYVQASVMATGVVRPDGYIFKDEHGNVINATKIVLEKKKKEYPKTYEECLSVLQIKGYDIVTYVPSWTAYEKTLYQEVLKLRELIIYRDAYWKIAGEEMGLGKPWEPDWDDDEWPDMYYISFDGKHLEKEKGYPCCNMILIFPTEEMRDAFYENFKSLIESCKELL
jgi:hypothetical protein